jgi:hypothetical protein
MNPFLINIIGYIGLVINLFSMSVNGEKKLRTFSLIANSIYIIYGICLGAFPVIIGSSIAVLLHSYRIIKMNRAKQ